MCVYTPRCKIVYLALIFLNSFRRSSADVMSGRVKLPSPAERSVGDKPFFFGHFWAFIQRGLKK